MTMRTMLAKLKCEILDDPLSIQDVVDYIVTTKGWRNSIADAESDTGANIDTDHYPVT